MDEEKKYLINVESNLEEYAKQAEAAKKRVDELTAENIKLKGSSTATAAEIEKSNAALRVAQNDYKNAQKAVENATRVNKAQAGSYEQLYQAWKNAQTQLKLMSNAYTINEKGVRTLSAEYVKQSKVVADMKASLDSFGRGVNDNRLNVGNYTNSIKAAMGEMQMMPGVLGQASSGVQRLGVAFKALIANPIVLTITAIVGALTALFKAFKSTDTGGTEVAARMEQLRVVVDILRQRLITLIEAFKHLFKGEFREAGEAFKATVTGIGEQFREATKAAYDYAYAMDAVKDAESNYISQSAEIRNEIAKLEFTAQDRTKSTAERKKALEEALRLGQEEVTKQREFAKAKLDAEIEYLAGKSNVRAEDIAGFIRMTDEEQANADESLKIVRNNNEAKFDEIEKLYAAWIDADTRFFEENKRNMSRMTGFTEQIANEREKAAEAAKIRKEAAEKEMQAAKERLTKEIADYKNSLDKFKEADAQAAEEKKNMDQQLADEKLERELMNQENLLAIREQNADDQFSIERERLQMEYEAEIRNAEKIGADINLINKKYALAQRKITEAQNKAKLDSYADFAGNIATLFGKGTAIGKAAAVAQVTIETYRAAMAAYTGMIEAFPGPWGIAAGVIAAAASVAVGVSNVKKILSTKSGLPGESGGGGSTSMPTTISASVPAQRAFTSNLQTSILEQPQLSQSQLNAQPNQNMLTADDIATAVSKLPPPVVTVEDINARTEESRKVEVRGTI